MQSIYGLLFSLLYVYCHYVCVVDMCRFVKYTILFYNAVDDII